MADISAIFFLLLLFGIAFPALLTAWWLLFPNLITRAQTRIAQSLASSFWLGLVVVILLAVPSMILLALPFGPAKFFGWIFLGASLALSSVGSAGIAAHLGERLTSHSYVSPLSGFIRGAVILELAAFFPVLGWLFVWIPMLVIAFGATGFALLNWMPRERVDREASMQVDREASMQVDREASIQVDRETSTQVDTQQYAVRNT